MKKLFVILVSLSALFAAPKALAQNVQVLYDTQRGWVTSTVEMFHPDSFGSTYFFVDLDASPLVSGAYWEISRELCFWQDTKLSCFLHMSNTMAVWILRCHSITAGLQVRHIQDILQIFQRRGH